MTAISSGSLLKSAFHFPGLVGRGLICCTVTRWISAGPLCLLDASRPISVGIEDNEARRKRELILDISL